MLIGAVGPGSPFHAGLPMTIRFGAPISTRPAGCFAEDVKLDLIKRLPWRAARFQYSFAGRFEMCLDKCRCLACEILPIFPKLAPDPEKTAKRLPDDCG